MSEAVFALLGVLFGSLTTIAVESMRSRREQHQRRTDALRVACAAFTSTLARIDLLSSAVKDSGHRDGVLQQLRDLQLQARSEYETLRLLLDSEATQRAGRMALRHAWALWKQAETGVDPRASEYSDPPWARYHRELRGLLVGVRRELGLTDPEAVFVEPID